jgi:hypothetical protein
LDTGEVVRPEDVGEGWSIPIIEDDDIQVSGDIPRILEKYNQNHDRHGRFTFGRGGSGGGGELDHPLDRPEESMISTFEGGDRSKTGYTKQQVEAELQRHFPNAEITMTGTKKANMESANVRRTVDGLVEMAKQYPKVAAQIRFINFTEKAGMPPGRLTVRQKRPVGAGAGDPRTTAGIMLLFNPSKLRQMGGMRSSRTIGGSDGRAVGIHEFGHAAHAVYEMKRNGLGKEIERMNGKGLLMSPQFKQRFNSSLFSPSLARNAGVHIESGPGFYNDKPAADLVSHVNMVGQSKKTWPDMAVSSYASKNPAELVAESWTARHYRESSFKHEPIESMMNELVGDVS